MSNPAFDPESIEWWESQGWTVATDSCDGTPDGHGPCSGCETYCRWPFQVMRGDITLSVAYDDDVWTISTQREVCKPQTIEEFKRLINGDD